MTTKSYSPGDWKISAFGYPVVGIKDGTFLKVSENAPGATMKSGAAGDVVITQGLDKTGKVEITLQRESPTNDLLSAKYAAWRAARTPTARAAATGSFFCKNINSTSGASGANCVIEKSPDLEGATEASGCVWVLLVDDVTIFNGGAIA